MVMFGRECPELVCTAENATRMPYLSAPAEKRLTRAERAMSGDVVRRSWSLSGI